MDAEAEAPILWPPYVKSQLIREEDPDAGNDWRQEEKGTTEDKMVGWHHRLDGHEFEQALGVGDGLSLCAAVQRERVGLNWAELFPFLSFSYSFQDWEVSQKRESGTQQDSGAFPLS